MAYLLTKPKLTKPTTLRPYPARPGVLPNRLSDNCQNARSVGWLIGRADLYVTMGKHVRVFEVR